MKKCTGILLLLLSFTLHAQENYWQQQVNYFIDVTLNDRDNTLQAFEKLTYINNSPNTLYFIWFHVWPNAYKNDRTAFSEQLLTNRITDFYWSKQEDKGYINQLNFEVNGVNAITQPHPQYIDVIKLMLPSPLAPHDSVNITTPFHEKLPFNISRGGHVEQTYQVTQWFPKPAVYDRKGWHEMPYLDQGEFYSEFGNWHVNITLPENYIVAASGKLYNEDELNKLRTLGRQQPSEQQNFKLFSRLVSTATTVPEQAAPASSSTQKTLTYTLNNAHDFAWFASKTFLVKYDTIVLNKHVIDAFALYEPWHAEPWQKSMEYIKDAIHFYSLKAGDYAYNEVTVVDGNGNVLSGGMEYPTITLITMGDIGGQQLDATMAHEIGHNWFYGMLGSNEREHPWMDEGINNFYQQQYEIGKYGETSDNKLYRSKLVAARMPSNSTKLLINSMEKIKKDQPVDTASQAYTQLNYGLMVYEKTPLLLRRLYNTTGAQRFDTAMHNYFAQWKFKHPYTEDFIQSFEASGINKINDFNYRIHTTGIVTDSNTSRSVKPTFFFNLNKTNKYNYISFTPVIGINNYDKLMIGGLIHNYQLPLNRFNFIASPLYATGSKQLNGVARLSYSIFNKKYWLEAAASASKFSINEYTNNDGSKTFLQVNKYVPSVKLTIYNKDPRSYKRWTLQARTFILKEDNFDFRQITDSTYKAFTTAKTSYINQLKIRFEDDRILYPYSGVLNIEQGKTFARTTFTGKYYLHYNKTTGLQARVFAGKFFYLNSTKNNLVNERYYLTMKGPDGYHDYTYSNYFIGRNEYEGWLSQQLMERDGFFKVETDLQPTESAVSDNWLFALNLASDLPTFANPFTILPFKLPVKIFADIGTFKPAGEAATDKILLRYDAGLQLSLYKSLLNIYVPIIYSKVYRNYYQSVLGNNYFWRTITFNISLNVFKLQNLNSSSPL